MGELAKRVPGWVIAVAILVFLSVFLERVNISGRPIVLFGTTFGPTEKTTVSPGRETTSAGFAKAPNVAWSSQDIKMSQQQCEDRARDTLERANFRGTGEASDVVYGYEGPYTGTIFCKADRGVVFFLVAGPESQSVKERREALKRGF